MDMLLTSYRLTEQLYTSATSLVFRARCKGDNQPVVLKILRDSYPSPERIAWLRHEYEIAHNLRLKGTAAAYALETDQQHWLMVLEDFGGESLTRLNLAGRLDLVTFLRLAINITEVLGQLHQQHIMHKDINPSNILLNPRTGQVKIIDFGISAVLSQENALFCNPNVLEGTLNYLSPEQTGRMNRAIDYRTDFYSLGATLYELLTGQVPFVSNDALELVHSHIARQPVPPHMLRADTPPALSAIILKLMAKNAEDRYQSAAGLRADLEECLHQWQTGGWISQLVPGQHDISDRFLVPQKLYGREQQLASLLEAFERVSRGGSELLLVSGPAGIGKTALVQELYRPVTRRRGYFIAGKFDQVQRATPYAAFVQALHALLNQLLTESETTIATWRSRVLAVAGSNGQVLIDVLPPLERIIGPQPPVPPLRTAEAHNRFTLLLEQFIGVFARREHPLVLLLDDLQWADAASLALLELLLTGATSQALLVIGAYRDDEIAAGHPLPAIQTAVAQAGLNITELALNPLGACSVRQLLLDMFACDEQPAASLAQVLLTKTGGNPFFLKEFLTELYSKGVLTFDYEQRQWQWDACRIQAQQLTNNLVDLLTGKLQRLPQPAREALKLAACIGNQFDLHLLATLVEQPLEALTAVLEQPLREGLIVPLSDTYKVLALDIPGLAGHINTAYMFAHDRIRQTIYNSIAAQSKQLAHWRIGHLLLQRQGIKEEQIFDQVTQLNAGRELITSQDERDMLAALNLQAGAKARTAAAYDLAAAYLLVGIELLGDAGWQRCYDLCLSLHIHLAAVAYMSGDVAALERLTDTVLARAQTLLDKIDIYEIHIQAYAARHKFLEAIQATLPALEALGVRIPMQPGSEDIAQGIRTIRAILAERPMDQVRTLPRMTDPQTLAAMRLLAGLFSVAYIGAPDLMPVVVCEQVILSLRHGHTSVAPFAFANYGLMLCGIQGEITAGAESGRLALRLLDVLEEKTCKARTLVTVNFFIAHWTVHLRETLDPLLEAYRSGLETGDFEYAGYAAYMHTCHALLIGTELPTLIDTFAEHDRIFARIQQERTRQQNGLYWQVAINLLGGTEQPWKIEGNHYSEQQMLPRLLAANDVPSLGNVYFCQMLLGYLFERYDQAAEAAACVGRYLDGLIGSLLIPLVHFYDSLVLLAQCGQVPSARQKHLLKRVASNQQQMRHWARHAPMNYQHKWYLVEAEYARVRKRYGDAREYYDQAVALARQHGYLNEEALAHELAGRFYLERGDREMALIYVRRAHYTYLRWRAMAKVRQLEERFPELSNQHAAASSFSPIIATTGTTQEASALLDLTSVIRGSQAISGELVMSTLLTRLMYIIIENAGAQRGLLLLEREGNWLIEAESVADRAEVKVLQGIAARPHHLPLTVMSYVVRTRATVVLHHAAQSGVFIHDPYITANQTRSLLCLPLLHQGHLSGLLYLENNLASGVFSTDRQEVLSLLAGQVAISLAHARLYSSMEELIAERTAELSRSNQALQEEMAKRERMAEALRSSEARFRMLAENAQDIIFRYRLKPTPAYEYISPAVQAILGYRPEDFYSDPSLHNRLASSDTFPQMPDLIQALQSHQGPFTLRIIRKDGREAWLEYHYRIAFDETGDPAAVEGIARDVTERKQAELQLLQQQQALAMLRERERLARELHDTLGQVLSYINTQAETIRDMLASGRVNLAAPLVAALVGVTHEAQADMREFLAGTRASMELRNLATDEDGFVAALIQHCHWLQQYYGLSIALHIAEDVTDTVLSPVARVHMLRIIQEALTNVRKHAGVGRAEVSLTIAEEHLHAVIADNGCGFDLKRVGAGRKDHPAPTGYGLHSMHGRAEEIGGHLHIDTYIGHGTRVQVQVPLLPQAAAYKAGIRVLLADDNTLFLDFLRSLLESQGVEVVGTASDGVEALTLTHALHPDVVLMDINMPHMNGLEATRRIHTELPGIQVVMLTVAEDDEHLFEAIKSGATGYLTKNLHAEDLYRLLLGVVRGEAPLAPGLASRVLREVAGHTESSSPEQPEQPDAAMLTARQREVLMLVAQGRTYKEVGRLLNFSESAIKYYMGGIMKQLQLTNRAAAVAYARRQMEQGAWPQVEDE